MRAQQPSQPVSLTLPFYARIQSLDAERELGVGSLLLTAVRRGVRWAPEVLDKVQGLVYTEPANRPRAGYGVDIHSMSGQFIQMLTQLLSRCLNRFKLRLVFLM